MQISHISGYHFHSIGIIAANKSLSSDTVEVTLVELLPMQDGEISDFGERIESKGVDGDGKNYEVKVVQGTTIEAQWRPLSTTNRITSPDVRRGETVMVYRMHDSDKYYWDTLGNSIKYRKLETVVLAFSATQDEDAELNADNYYFLEISTHKGMLHLGTSTANGEACRYDLQLNTKNGFFKFEDGVGNFISLESLEKRIEFYNADESHVDINKQDITITVKGNSTVNTGNNTKIESGANTEINTKGDATVNTDGNVSIITKGINTMKGALNKIIGAIQLMGPVSVTSEDGSSPGIMKMKGNIEHEGDMLQQGNLQTNNITANVVTGNHGNFPNLD